ncbi:hypothetical protein [Streptomyces sp. NPDC046860]|uniref:hypothetical protein n=1 Tax=Streptomyces sp. NPDC046860 TaxID=3154495 RepID=UPI0033F54957
MAEKFVQIIAFETDRIDEMRTLAMDIDRRFGGIEHGPTYQAVLKDKNQDDRYYEVLEFSSLEAAARSRHDPEARAFAERMAALCTSPPSFIECDLLEASRPN